MYKVPSEVLTDCKGTILELINIINELNDSKNNEPDGQEEIAWAKDLVKLLEENYHV